MSEVGPLLDRLTIASKALSPQNIVPLLNCFWFLGDGRVIAYNDIQAAETFTEITLKAAVPGEELHSLLSTFPPGAACVLAHNGENTVELKSGGSTIHLQNIPLDTPPFSFPTKEADDWFACGEEFFTGLRHCLLSTGGEGESQVRGVTLMRAKNGIVLYSTDNLTLSRYLVETKRVPLIKAPMMLPAKFCEQVLLAYSKTGEKSPILAIYPGGVVVEFPSAGTKLFSKLDITPSLDFEQVIAMYYTEGDAKYAFKAPEWLEPALNRIAIVSDRNKDKVSSWIFSVGSLVVKNRDAANYIEEVIKCPSKVKCEFAIDTTLVQRALKSCDELFALPGKALVLFGNSRKFLHLISFYA